MTGEDSSAIAAHRETVREWDPTWLPMASPPPLDEQILTAGTDIAWGAVERHEVRFGLVDTRLVELEGERVLTDGDLTSNTPSILLS